MLTTQQSELISQVHQTTFLCPLQDLGLVAVTGPGYPDVVRFLQGQLSCDVTRIDAQTSLLGVHCNPKGRVIVTLRLVQYEGQLYLLLPRAILANTLLVLKKYAQFFKVTLTDVTALFGLVGLSGVDSPQLLQTTLSAAPDAIDTVLTSGSITQIRVPGIEPRFIILGPTAAIEQWQQALPAVVTRASRSLLWTYLDIAAGIASVTPTTLELFTPHELNFQLINGICFTKGCYTGQEIIARMQYLGKLKQHLYRVALQGDAAPEAGETIENGDQQAIGTIALACPTGPQQFEALAVLKDEATTQLPLRLQVSGGQIVQVLPLPYSFSEAG